MNNYMNNNLHPYYISFFTGRGASRLTNGRIVFMASIILIVSVFSLLTGLVPKAGATGEQIVMGMPFDGKWAYNVATTASCGYTSGLTAHPSCHGTNGSDLLGYDWATDYYAASGTAVKVNGTSLQGTVTFSSADAGIQSCGNGLNITANANGNSTGQIYVTHLDNSVVSSSLSNGATIGTIHYQCFGVDHVHFSYKNTAGNHACYVNYSNQNYTAGMNVSYAAPIGVLGSSNTGVQQVCSSIPSNQTSLRSLPTSDGHIQLFKISNGTLSENWYSPSNGTVGSWTQPVALPAQATGTPTVVARSGQSVIDVFVRGGDNQVYETWYNWGNGQWGGWISMGGTVTSDPQAQATSDGHDQVFGTGNNLVQQSWFSPSNGSVGGWSTSAGLSANASGSPALVPRTGQSVIDEFVRGGNNQLYETWYNWGTGAWGGWINMGGTDTSDPQAQATSDGHDQVFGTSNNLVQQNWFSPSDGSIGNWISF